MIEHRQLEKILHDTFPGCRLRLIDLTGTQDHYELHLASDRFVGLRPIERHRLVYGALQEELRGEIHALSLKLYEPTQWPH